MTTPRGATVRCAIYCRVSTVDRQTTENQELELRAVAEHSGWEVTAVYADQGVSGTKADRPALKKLLRAVARREVDMVAAWSVDRLGRSLQHLLALLGEIHATGADLYLHQQGLDTRTPGGKAMFQMLGVFAEFERAMIVERVHAGLRRAKARGTRLGRPPVAVALERKIRAALTAGQSFRAVAAAHGVGLATVQRVQKRAAVPA